MHAACSSRSAPARSTGQSAGAPWRRPGAGLAERRARERRPWRRTPRYRPAGARDLARRAGRRSSTTCTSSARPSTPSWAITTSQGIILLDAIYDYSVEDEVDEGLQEARTQSRRHQVRHRQPRPPRSRRRRQVPAGEVRRAPDHVGGRLRPARPAEPVVEAEARHGGDRRA